MGRWGEKRLKVEGRRVKAQGSDRRENLTKDKSHKTKVGTIKFPSLESLPR
jgi:hypothetical protein